MQKLSSILLRPFSGNNLKNLAKFAYPTCSYSNDCDALKPRCGEALKGKSPCPEDPTKDKTTYTEKWQGTLWENPECCQLPCPDMLPRFDELYYKPSDKAKRQYQQTWIECKPRPVCRLRPCIDPECFIYPPITKRPPPKTACPFCPRALSCKLTANVKCVKITLPCCADAKDPPKCKLSRRKTKCKKICCPYPSYSECCKPKPTPRMRRECNCLNKFAACEMWRYIKKHNICYY